MFIFLIWYLTVSLIGLAVFPLAYRLLPALPDRGYALSRTLGILCWGYLFWLLTSLGILRNDLGGQVFALAALLALSALALRSAGWKEIWNWAKSHNRLILSLEMIFFAAFAGWAVVRAANPDLTSTEKPMELAFINAILRSPSMPPNDPWLSGYAISYYYFGYVIIAMLARMSGALGSVAHNLGTALIFGLGAVGAYGIVYNLLAQFTNRKRLYALLGPLFILLVSNLEGLLEILHARRLFWQTGASGEVTSSFWSWLGIADLNQPPVAPAAWVPRMFGTGSWWWWRASRVVQDFNFAWAPKEIIDEFPFFSFLLADLHPHVIAIPFVFLAISLALNLYLDGGDGSIHLPGTKFHLAMSRWNFLLAAVTLGGIFFLNASDFPFYVVLIAGAYALGRIRSPLASILLEFIVAGLALGAAGYLLYLPFHLSFSSQVTGINPSLIYFTRGAHLWVVFAPLLLPIGAYLFSLWRLNGKWPDLKRGLLAALGILLGLWSLSMLLAVLRVLLEGALLHAGGVPLIHEFSAPDWPSLLSESIRRRLMAPGGWITLTLLLAGVLGMYARLFSGIRHQEKAPRSEKGEIPDTDNKSAPNSSLTPFVLWIILVGAVLVMGPDFFYLRDQFNSRFNTIFKFYYQAWLLWGIAAAYGSAVLLCSLRRTWVSIPYRLGLLLLIIAALIYPFYGLIDKTYAFNPPEGWTLDGGAYLERWAPDELAAIRWLQSAPFGILVEAVEPRGGQYSDFARISTYTGLPTVLGWVGHESQWRGSDEPFRGRQADIERLYITRDWEQAQEILQQYLIRYVVVGPRERGVYRVFETKFERSLNVVFRQGQVTIYEVP